MASLKVILDVFGEVSGLWAVGVTVLISESWRLPYPVKSQSSLAIIWVFLYHLVLISGQAGPQIGFLENFHAIPEWEIGAYHVNVDCYCGLPYVVLGPSALGS